MVRALNAGEIRRLGGVGFIDKRRGIGQDKGEIENRLSRLRRFIPLRSAGLAGFSIWFARFDFGLLVTSKGNIGGHYVDR
jgi:hypothetical protein